MTAPKPISNAQTTAARTSGPAGTDIPADVVTGGVDTHSDVHVAAALSAIGGVLGTSQFPTTAAGYRELLAWLRSFGPLGRVGVEGTGSYGAALARHLAGAGVTVIEVNRPNRQTRRRYGKTDVVDAISAARAVLSREATATPKSHDGQVECLRLLRAVARGANQNRTQALNQISQLIVTAPEVLRARLRDLGRREQLEVCAGFRVRAEDDTVEGVTRLALRELAQRIGLLDEQIALMKVRLKRITASLAPALVAAYGVGPVVATTLLITVGDNPGRLRDERCFAALAGVSPIPASSGKTTRHRLNRGGDRQANSALWTIAMVRLASHKPTQDYMAKRLSEGKTKTEIIRCLKRYIAREIYTLLPAETASA